MLAHENCEGKEKKIYVTIYKHPFLGNIVKHTIPPLPQELNTNNTPKSLEKYLTLPSCSETTPPLVLGGDSAALPEPAFASGNKKLKPHFQNSPLFQIKITKLPQHIMIKKIKNLINFC